MTLDTLHDALPQKKAPVLPGGAARRAPVAVIVLIVLVLCLIALVVATGILGRSQTRTRLERTTTAAAIPDVSLVTPEHGPNTRSLDLPGDVAAWYEAPIYGQVSGYVSKWFTDFGAEVKKGQVLATIDTPSLDEELDAAKATLAVSQARYQLAVVTARRWQSLAGTQAVSQQEVDVNVANAQAQQAQVSAQQHNVARVQAREVFKALVAPFDGIVTARNTDVGDYVNGEGSNTSGSSVGAAGRSAALFRVADVHEMRLFVSVPQDFAGYMREGVTATFTISQSASRVFQARFLTTAKSVNTTSRTVVTELTADNTDRALWPGTYATVHFIIPTDPNTLVVPAQALLFRSDGLVVCLVGSDNKIHIQKVSTGLNFGAKVQVTDGLKISDKVVANPSANLLEGAQVNVVAPSSASPAGSSAPKLH